MGSITVKLKNTGVETNYDEVVLDVRRVEVKFANTNTNGEFGKYFLDAHLGEYDLLNDNEETEGEIANKKRMPTGTLTEIRIVVGDGSYIVVNGAKHSLQITNSPNSGLTLPLESERIYGDQQAKLILNIDVAGSVIQSGGGYTLNPLIEVGG